MYIASRLNEYINNYEILDYSSNEIHEKHLRVKRWAGVSESPEIHINFNAHNKQFHLRLRRDTSVFSDNLQVDGDALAPNEELDTSHLYSGHLQGEVFFQN